MKKILISILTILSISIIILCITNIDTTKATPATLADTVIALSQGDSWGIGASGVYYTNSHEYRYIGANVNNYVSFNNTLFRIIGVFDSNSTGISGNLVKLIRARSIGSYSWGVTNTTPEYTSYSTYTDNWETANVNILLNEYFLNATDTSSTYGLCSDWTYYYSSNNYKTGDCSDIIGYGIQTENLRNYIQPVTWYLKGYISNSYNRQEFYTCERSDATTITDCNSGNSGAYATKVTNKSMGLMYVSDYMYASGYVESDYQGNGTVTLGRENWLYNGMEWTITTQGDTNSKVMFINEMSRVNSDSARVSYGIRPTFYLKSSVYVTGGDGSFQNPYTIACDNCNS